MRLRHLVVLAAFLAVTFGATAQSSKKGAATVTSPAASSPTASTPNATGSGSAPDTSDIASWVSYQAMTAGLDSVASRLQKSACTKFTFVTPTDRLASSAVVRAFNKQTADLKSELCVGAKLRLSIHVSDDLCTPDDDKHFLPGLPTAIATASSLVQLVASIKPSYTMQSGSATIDPLAIQRTLIADIGPEKFYGPRVSVSDLDNTLLSISQIQQLDGVIAAASNPGGAKQKQWAMDQTTLTSAADGFLSAINDPGKSFIHDFLIAGSTSYITDDVCSLSISAHAGASSLIGKTGIFSSNGLFEAGAVVLSYELSKTDGQYAGTGLVTAICELQSEYKLGKGAPPDPSNVKCMGQLK